MAAARRDRLAPAEKSAIDQRSSQGGCMKRLELFIEGIILASRWLLVIFYVGLGIALALYAVTFGYKL